MNVELLRKVGRLIVANPESFALYNYYATGKRGCSTPYIVRHNSDLGDLSSCGSVMCIAGWTEAVTTGPTPDPRHNAARSLDLESQQAANLFYGDSEGWRQFGGWKATADQAQARIELFIETGGEV